MTAQVALPQGQYVRAASFSDEAAEVWRQIGDNRGLAHELVQLSIAVRCQGDANRALDLGREALDLFRRLGETWGIVGALVVVAAARATLDQANTAVRLLAAEDVFAKTFGQPPSAMALACVFFISPSRLVDEMTAMRLNSMSTSD